MPEWKMMQQIPKSEDLELLLQHVCTKWANAFKIFNRIGKDSRLDNCFFPKLILFRSRCFHCIFANQTSTMNEIIWSLKPFHELGPHELYDILRLRSEVFVVEQQCIFLDMDNKDQVCHHLQGRLNDELIVSVRIVPPGIAYDEPSIGRVVGSPRHRGIGAGKALMKKAIEETIRLYGEVPIKIGAQLYLKKFYEEQGFVQCSETYMEDDIPHIKMLRNT